MTNFRIVERPGYFGKRRDEFVEKYNIEYGLNNWKIAWLIGENLRWVGGKEPVQGRYVLREFPDNCKLYAYSYLVYFQKHRDELEWIVENYENVFDKFPNDVNSGLDFTKQEANYTHLQDIAIRIVAEKLALEFKGRGLLQIRTGVNSPGEKWSPAMILFCKPELIMRPELKGWWDKGIPDSIECWYQSNKVLMVKA